tara:strand:+ start:114 stop:572 length:459 start_codon:yes stop_codon:yes gene_type:complete
MKISTHLYTSTLLSGGLYAVTRSPQIALSCFLSGIFIDIDHVFDFLIFSGEKFSIKNMISWCNESRWEKIVLIFHSYEVLIFLSFIMYYFPGNILMGILLGGGLHLVLDQIGNCFFGKQLRASPWFYFLTFRVFSGFRKEKLLRQNLTPQSL